MGIDMLYILGSSSKWDNNEIKYSLRSVAKYAKNINRVFVVGENPGFFSDKVKYIYCDDPKYRAYNHYHKVRHVIETTDISDNFILNYDDNFLLTPTDMEKYPYYSKGLLPPTWRVMSGYRECMVNTRVLLEKHNKNVVDYCVHTPVIYNRLKFKSLYPIFESCESMQYFVSPRAVYCNWYEVPPVAYQDLVLRNITGFNEVLKLTGRKHIYSINDRAIHRGVEEHLNKLFPEKCIYEA